MYIIDRCCFQLVSNHKFSWLVGFDFCGVVTRFKMAAVGEREKEPAKSRASKRGSQRDCYATYKGGGETGFLLYVSRGRGCYI
jgi:hypothetical protein